MHMNINIDDTTHLPLKADTTNQYEENQEAFHCGSYIAFLKDYLFIKNLV